jgi:hypothetical protein
MFEENGYTLAHCKHSALSALSHTFKKFIVFNGPSAARWVSGRDIFYPCSRSLGNTLVAFVCEPVSLRSGASHVARCCMISCG